MTYKTKPIIVISKCLGFEACRYNGVMESNSFVEKLKDYVTFITVCPEQECGLDTPRELVRIVSNEDGYNLVMPKSNINLTNTMKQFTNKFLSELGEIDGFILKSKSPSCGLKDAKIYPKKEKCAANKRGSGFFAEEVLKRYPNACIEDEGRLTNYKIRERFLTNIFIISSFRNINATKSFDDLRKFHLDNTLLLLSYSQKYSKMLDELIYNDEVKNINKLFNEYNKILRLLLSKTPRYTSNINVCLKAIDQFRDQLSDEELQFIWSTIDKYRNAIIPFSVLQYLLKGYIIRFKIENLVNQTFFNPYPEALIQVTDSGKNIH